LSVNAARLGPPQGVEHVAIETADRELACAEQAAEMLAPELGWSAGDREHELTRYRETVAAELRV